jgi:hypothetical protein
VTLLFKSAIPILYWWIPEVLLSSTISEVIGRLLNILTGNSARGTKIVIFGVFDPEMQFGWLSKRLSKVLSDSKMRCFMYRS